MINNNISKMVVEKIQKDGIKPTSKLKFNAKKILFWFLIIFSVIFGSLAFATMLFLLNDNDWDIYKRLGYTFILKTLPYFWFICLVLLLIIGEYYYRKTLFGYRYRLLTISGVYITVTILLGLLTFNLGFGKYIDSLGNNIPAYHNMMFNKEEIWSHPENGLLFGKIQIIKEDKIQIIDSKNNLWEIDASQAFITNRVNLIQGEIIKIIGKIENKNTFIAEEIRPWIGRGMGLKQQKINTMR